MKRSMSLLAVLALVLVTVVAARVPQAAAPVYEHTYVEALVHMKDTANWPGWRDGAPRMANAMSAQGWELVQVIPLPREDNSLLGVGLFFRRPRP